MQPLKNIDSEFLNLTSDLKKVRQYRKGMP